MSFWCLQISQKTNEKFSRISAIASKKRSIFCFDFITLFFLFELFLQLGISGECDLGLVSKILAIKEILIIEYGFIANSNTSCLEPHPGFYRWLMKGILDP